MLLLVHADLPLAITFSTSQWCKHLGNTRLLQHPHRGKLRMRPQKHGDPQDPWQQGWRVPGEEMGHVDGVGTQQGSGGCCQEERLGGDAKGWVEVPGF